MSEKDYSKLSDSEKKKEDWMNSKWRPMMGWSYMLTCIADFVIFPVLWSVLQSLSKGQVNIQWQPITLQGAGLYHIAMGAVLGIAAYGRTQEKLGGANNGGLQGNVGSTYQVPTAVGQQAGNFGAPMAMATPTSFGGGGFSGGMQQTSMGGGFGHGGAFASAGGYNATTFTSRSGKPGPMQPDYPEI